MIRPRKGRTTIEAVADRSTANGVAIGLGMVLPAVFGLLFASIAAFDKGAPMLLSFGVAALATTFIGGLSRWATWNGFRHRKQQQRSLMERLARTTEQLIDSRKGQVQTETQPDARELRLRLGDTPSE